MQPQATAASASGSLPPSAHKPAGHSHHHSISHAAAGPASVAAAASASVAATSTAAAPSSSSASATASAPSAAIVAAASSPLLVDLVRKLAAFRRGLVFERKQRQLLELQLEEYQLKNEALSLQQREQDVQLLTSLELSASLEHALHMSAVDVPQTHGIHERQLEGIFAKPKKEAEAEIKRLFGELSNIQQFYHELEKRALKEKVSSDAQTLKLNRDLKTATDALDKSKQEVRKFRLRAQELIQDLSDLREEVADNKAAEEKAREERAAELQTLRASVAAKDAQLEAMRLELDAAKSRNSVLSSRSLALSEKVQSLELTVRHFTCTRILARSAHNVSCEISIKKIPLTGELMLCVKDYRRNVHKREGSMGTGHAMIAATAAAAAATSAASAASPATSSSSSAAVSSALSPCSDEIDSEYCQEISSVRCRSVDEDVPFSPNPPDLLGGSDNLGEIHTLAHTDGGAGFAGTTGASGSDALRSSDPSSTVLLGYRPRFLLCFTGDNHRVLLFETESTHFRAEVLGTLRQFIVMAQEKHVDELATFFGDQANAGTTTVTVPSE